MFSNPHIQPPWIECTEVTQKITETQYGVYLVFSSPDVRILVVLMCIAVKMQ